MSYFTGYPEAPRFFVEESNHPNAKVHVHRLCLLIRSARFADIEGLYDVFIIVSRDQILEAVNVIRRVLTSLLKNSR
jgi:hypothetical protein